MRIRFVLLVSLLLAGCESLLEGKDFELIKGDIEGTIESVEEQKDFLEANPDAISATGSYAYDQKAGRISITIIDSDFSCDGPPTGSKLAFEVLEINNEILKVQDVSSHEDEQKEPSEENGDDEPMVFDRVSGDAGLAGSWKLQVEEDQTILMTFSESGDFILSMSKVNCNEDTKNNQDRFDENGCLNEELPRINTAIDGRSREWMDGDEQGNIALFHEDGKGDTSGPSGTDFTDIWMGYNTGRLQVMFVVDGEAARNLMDTTTTTPYTHYALLVEDDAGNETEVAFAYYNDQQGYYDWAAFDLDQGKVLHQDVASARADGPNVETSVSWDHLGNPAGLNKVAVVARECDASGDCTTWDISGCVNPIGEIDYSNP